MSNLQKKFIKIFSVVFIVVLLIGAGTYLYNKQLIGTPKTEVGSYEYYTSNIYQNKKFGFQVELPASWKRYAVREGEYEDGSVVWFGLPLQGDKIKEALAEPQSSSSVIDRGGIVILPIVYFDAHKNDCENSDEPCVRPIEIKRNDVSVFSLYVPDPNLWDYCGVTEGTEPYVCSVDRDLWSWNPKINDTESILQRTFKFI